NGLSDERTRASVSGTVLHVVDLADQHTRIAIEHACARPRPVDYSFTASTVATRQLSLPVQNQCSPLPSSISVLSYHLPPGIW
ncbi:MAG TPA: hypothetical protein VFL19_05685, partial [Nitrospira sp.]|nr:hypothetical protein [Nitrospira sp.]